MEYLDIVVSLLALIVLEIVLGIDNLVFLAILTEKLPKEQQKSARRWGLTFAWVTRLILLASAVWLTKLTRPLLSVAQFSFSARDIFLFVGGMFLITKATQEIHNEVAKNERATSTKPKVPISFTGVVVQVALMDIIFSLDSVLTALGLTNNFIVMATAISIAILVMVFASEPVSHFIDEQPTLKMLALTFLILIGTVLVADSFSYHLPRGYIYFAMGFSLAVEVLNLIAHPRRKK
ncbi:MAG: TerC family protein [Tatlockia sp.]|nr:TerC family protein [Tatlockia sp.]